MKEYPKEILQYIIDFDSGLNLEFEDFVAIINTKDLSILDLVKNYAKTIFFVSENENLRDIIKQYYPDVKFIRGNEENTGIEDKTIRYIYTDENLNYFNIQKTRKEFKRILSNCSDDLIIFEDEIQIKLEILSEIYAGSWYEKKVFEKDTQQIVLYHNPPGFNEEELNSKVINEFIGACQHYCYVIDNYQKYSVEKFLYETQKSLVDYYRAGFFLPATSPSSNASKITDNYSKADIKAFFKMHDDLEKFLGIHNLYWSNFDPYPDDEDKETFVNSLSNDLAEIYEDLFYNLQIFNHGNIYDKQNVMWQFIFDWKGHTGDHWTFAVRAIHWKLHELGC